MHYPIQRLPFPLLVLKLLPNLDSHRMQIFGAGIYDRVDIVRLQTRPQRADGLSIRDNRLSDRPQCDPSPNTETYVRWTSASLARRSSTMFGTEKCRALSVGSASARWSGAFAFGAVRHRLSARSWDVDRRTRGVVAMSA